MSGAQSRNAYKQGNIFRAITGHARKDGRVRLPSARTANNPALASLIRRPDLDGKGGGDGDRPCSGAPRDAEQQPGASPEGSSSLSTSSDVEQAAESDGIGPESLEHNTHDPIHEDCCSLSGDDASGDPLECGDRKRDSPEKGDEEQDGSGGVLNRSPSGSLPTRAAGEVSPTTPSMQTPQPEEQSAMRRSPSWLTWIPSGGRGSELKALSKPTKEPQFPDIFAAGGYGTGAPAANPSDSCIAELQTGLLCKGSRNGYWSLRYAVLTKTCLHFFSTSNAEFLGSHDSLLPLCRITQVRELPDLLGSQGQHAALELVLDRQSNENIKICAFDAPARAKWRDAILQAMGAFYERLPKLPLAAMPEAVGQDRIGISALPSVLFVSCGTKSSSGPSSGNRVLSTSPDWGTDAAIAARLRPGEELRVWLSDGTVCCFQPEKGNETWYNASSGLRLVDPPHHLDYRVEVLNERSGTAGAPSTARGHVQVTGVSAVLLVLILAMGWAPAISALWTLVLMAASAAGALVFKDYRLTLKAEQVELHLVACLAPSSRSDPGLADAAGAPKPASNYDSQDILPKVDASKLAQLREMCPGQINEVELARFLISRQGDVQAAAAMFERNQEMREMLEPVLIEEVLPFMRADYVHFLGFARDRTPLVKFNVRNLSNRESADHLMKLLLRICDLGAVLRPDLQCLTLIIDFKDFTLRNNFDFGKMHHISNVLNGALPEVLRQCFIINAPVIFQAVWKILSNLLEEKTTQKIQILHRNEWTNMLEYIDASVLPTYLGGNFEDTYNALTNTETHLDWGHVPVPKGWPPPRLP